MSTEFVESDQRYYHVVVFGKKVPWTLRALWKAVDGSASTTLPDTVSRWGKIEFRTIAIPRPPVSIPTEEGRSLKRDSKGNYLIDLFAAEVERRGDRYVAFGVPYVQIGQNLGPMLRRARLMQGTDFLRADTRIVVEAVRSGLAAPLGVGIAKVQVRVNRHPEISGFSLSGEDAVLSKLYGRIMGDIGRQQKPAVSEEHASKKEKEGVLFSRCTVRQLDSTDGAMSIHCDSHGNFRVWVQRNGRNLGMLGHWISALRAMNADSLVSDYPMYRQHGEPE